MPEAHANMGFALAGLGRHREAKAFFEGALDLRPRPRASGPSSGRATLGVEVVVDDRRGVVRHAEDAEDLAPVDCGSCHSGEQAEESKSLHGQAAARGQERFEHAVGERSGQDDGQRRRRLRQHACVSE